MSGQKPREIAVRVLQARGEMKGITGLRGAKRGSSDLDGVRPLGGSGGEKYAGDSLKAELHAGDTVKGGLHAGSGRYVEDLLEEALSRANLSVQDRALCQELVYGVVRWQGTLDWLIARKSDERSKKPPLTDILRLGLYQIFWLSRIPNHAAVNETVQLTRSHRLTVQAGFVNAVLRGYLREFEATQQLLSELKVSQPDIGYSHPKWLVERWQARWGKEQAAALMGWNNTPPPTFARVNTLKTEPGKLLAQWREEGVDYDFVRQDWLEENLVFVLKSHPALSKLASFQQGMFYVQDPSTLLAVRELAPQPGEAILDLCAAPGGKLTYMAQLVRNEAKIVAEDVSEERLKLVSENCERLGVTCVRSVLRKGRVNEGDTPGVAGGTPAPLPSGGAAALIPSIRALVPGLFDRILIDAPCSNTGVLRRRVDLRWRLRPEEIERLRGAQLELLRSAAVRLRPGGTLVYSTCSLEPEENDGVVNEFLSSQPGFKLESRRELLPFIDGVDGGYVAKLQRVHGA